MTVADAAPPKISDDELRIEREKLEVWSTPQEFHDRVDALAAKFSHEDRFNSPRFPDGFVTTKDNKTLKVEVTEADHEDQRRGDEYKDGGKAKERNDSEGVNVIAKELERVIQKKAHKLYKPKPTLVVWLNLDKQEIGERDVVAVLEDTRSKYAGSFEKIFILWRGKVL